MQQVAEGSHGYAWKWAQSFMMLQTPTSSMTTVLVSKLNYGKKKNHNKQQFRKEFVWLLVPGYNTPLQES